MVFFIFIHLLFNVQEQNTIVVHVDSDNPFAKFEQEVIKESISFLNKRHRLSYEVKFNYVKKYSELFAKVNNSSEQNNSHNISINALSITPERKRRFEFSASYMPNKSSFLSFKKKMLTRNSKIGYLTGGIVEENISQIKEKYPYKFIPYEDYMTKIKDLKSSKIDQAITDYIDIWSHNLIFIEDIKFLKKDRFAVLLAKNCSLLKKLKDTFKYFFSSPSYYKIIREHFGTEALNYFKRNRD